MDVRERPGSYRRAATLGLQFSQTRVQPRKFQGVSGSRKCRPAGRTAGTGAFSASPNSPTAGHAFMGAPVNDRLDRKMGTDLFSRAVRENRSVPIFPFFAALSPTCGVCMTVARKRASDAGPRGSMPASEAPSPWLLRWPSKSHQPPRSKPSR